MIVDDTKMIIGSANINDRSLWGSRDSELAAYLEGEPDICIELDSSRYYVNSKIHEFRTNIFMEHFGMEPHEVIWASSELFWKTAYNIMRINTQFYERVFKVFPSNLYRDFNSLNKREKNLDRRAFDDLKDLVSGFAVEYPFNFLRDEHLENAKYDELALAFAPYRLFL